MVKIEKVDTQSKSDIRRFIQIPFRLYKDHPQWVPPLYIDAETPLNPKKHRLYPLRRIVASTIRQRLTADGAAGLPTVVAMNHLFQCANVSFLANQ